MSFDTSTRRAPAYSRCDSYNPSTLQAPARALRAFAVNEHKYDRINFPGAEPA